MLLISRLALLSVLSSTLLACSHTPQVSVFPKEGKDYWSRRVQETWLPKTRMAVEKFGAFTKQAGLPDLLQVPRIQLIPKAHGPQETSSENGLNPRIDVVLLPNDSIQELHNKALIYPLTTLTEQLAEQLSVKHLETSPLWLRKGSAYAFADTVLEQMQMHDLVQARRADRESWLRSPACSDTQALLSQAENASGSLESVYAAEWMLKELRAQSGAYFMPGWQTYFRRAGAPGFEHEREFNRAFGLSMNTFMQKLDTRLHALRNERRSHAATPPPPSSYARIDDTEQRPLKVKDIQKGYARYLEARSPKAFALSPRGSWSYVDDDAKAMELALTLCRQYDPVSCQLYAVDNEVVYTAFPQNTSGIEVLMVSDGDDGWTQSIKTSWIPFVQNTANTFNSEILAQMGVALDASARIYVASTREDYAKTLSDKLQTLSIETAHHRDHSVGVADGDGQIAVLLPSNMPREQMSAQIAEVVLHELAHEWQGQLSKRYAGFRPPRWITEGSAEVLSARLGAKLPGDLAKQFSLDDRRTRLIHWYKLEATPSADKVFTAKAKDWAEMSASGERHYQMAELMTHFLATELGERSPSALRAYFESAGHSGQKADKAFNDSFGMTPEVFITSFKTWLKSL